MIEAGYDEGRRSTASELKRDAQNRLIYEVRDPVLAAYILSRKMVSVIQGPIRSGKSKVSNLKIWAISSEQRAGPDGMRRTRWAVIRNTYAELRTTTARTWLDTFPEATYGRLVWSKPGHQVIRYADIVIEVDFLALDSVDDVGKLRSGEYTGFYINELQYLPKELFDECTSRAGAYPAKKDGGPSWYGVIADMNAPDEDHFIAMMTGQVDWPEGMPEDERAALRWPEEWDFFMQPSAVLEVMGPDGRSVVNYRANPVAENVHWLPGGAEFYLRQLKGKTRPWIDSRIMNRIAFVAEGSPVWPMFRAETHMATEVLKPVPGHEVVVGLDFGRNPAAVFMQALNNRVYVQYEMQGTNESSALFAPRVKRFLETHYPGFTYRAYGDPKGEDRGQANEEVAYRVFEVNGIVVRAAPGMKHNSIRERVEVVSTALMAMDGGATGGLPRVVFSPLCRSLKVACLGRYFLERDDSGELKPKKNRYSDIADALQYAFLGLGEGRRMLGLTPALVSRAVVYHHSRSGRRRLA